MVVVEGGGAVVVVVGRFIVLVVLDPALSPVGSHAETTITRTVRNTSGVTGRPIGR